MVSASVGIHVGVGRDAYIPPVSGEAVFHVAGDEYRMRCVIGGGQPTKLSRVYFVSDE